MGKRKTRMATVTNVNEANYALAESQAIFDSYRKKICAATGDDHRGMGVFMHLRTASDPKDTTIMRANYDTFYSFAILDLRECPATLVMPPRKRYQSAWLVDEEHYNPFAVNEPGSFAIDEDGVGNRCGPRHESKVPKDCRGKGSQGEHLLWKEGIDLSASPQLRHCLRFGGPDRRAGCLLALHALRAPIRLQPQSQRCPGESLLVRHRLRCRWERQHREVQHQQRVRCPERGQVLHDSLRSRGGRGPAKLHGHQRGLELHLAALPAHRGLFSGCLAIARAHGH